MLKEEKEEISLKSQSFCSSLLFYTHNSWIEIKRRFCYYLLAFLSVMVVCLATAVCQSIIDNAPLIFLKTAEGEAAERDIVISPAATNNNNRPQMYNYTKIKSLLLEKGDFATARSDFAIRFWAPKIDNDCDLVYSNPQDYINNQQQKVKQNLKDCDTLEGTLLLMDTKIEKKIDLGREYPYEAITPGSCILHEKSASALGVKEGDTLKIEINLDSIITLAAKKYKKETGNDPQQYGTQKFVFPVKVEKIFFETFGKYPDGTVQRSLLMEIDDIFNQIMKYNTIKNDNNFDAFFRRQIPKEYAKVIVINIPERIKIYLESNFDKVQKKVTELASIVSERLGVYPYDMTLPVLDQLFTLRFGAMFLGIILNMIIFILFLLSCILLYSLLLVSIETKTFDLGVVRMLGINKLGVVMMILVQCLSYVIPGIIIGLVLSLPALRFASNTLHKAAGVNIPNKPTPNAVGFSIGLSILIPLLSSYKPINTALAQSLQQALDVTHSKTSAVRITMISEGNEFPWGRIQFALISTMFGISIYYLLPKALLSFDLGLLIAIFFVILMGMLLGFVIMSLNVQHLLEKLVVYVFFFFSNTTRTLIMKNLAAHRIRNRRTGIMYSLSLAFVIFLVVSYTSQTKTSIYSTKLKRGCYIEISGDGSSIPLMPYDTFIRENLTDLISSYSWITEELNSFAEARGVKSVYLTHVGQYYTYQPKIVGVSPNLFKTTFSEFLDISSSSDTGLDLIEELYTSRGSQSMIIGKTYSDELNVGIGKEDSLFIVFYNGSYTKRFELRVSAVLKNAAAFRFSQLPSVLSQSIVISLPTFKRMAGKDLVPKLESLPMNRILIKIKGEDEYDKEKIGKIYNQMQSFIQQRKEDNIIKIWDFRDYERTIKQSDNMINIIFTIVIIIVMFLCFFSLVSSMSANIVEQTKEISVLRSLGMNRRRMVLLYIYEAFVLVFSSSFMGLCIGTIVGFTMTLQRVLFTQLPITFDFPLMNFIVILIVSVLVSLFSTLIPAYRLMKKEITVIARMTN